MSDVIAVTGSCNRYLIGPANRNAGLSPPATTARRVWNIHGCACHELRVPIVLSWVSHCASAGGSAFLPWVPFTALWTPLSSPWRTLNVHRNASLFATNTKYCLLEPLRITNSAILFVCANHWVPGLHQSPQPEDEVR